MKPVIAHYLDSRVFGGTERVAISLLRELSGRWRTILLLHDDAPVEIRQAAKDAELEVARLTRVSGGPGGIARARSELRCLRPAVFHAQRAWPIDSEGWLLAARLAGITAVLTTEHLFPKRLPRRGVFRERLLDPLLDMRIAVSEHVARRVRQAFGTPERRLRVVLNGIDPRPFQSGYGADVLRRTLCPGGQPLILTVAHLRAQKGLDSLVRVAAVLPDVVFAVAGEGPDRAALQRDVDASGLTDRVVLLGQRDDIPRLLESCDLFVLPSRDEGLPLAVLEAMAARRPVVATRVGGVPEAIVDGQHGRLVAPDDPRALAAAIADLLADSGQARTLAARAYARLAERFTVERMAAETEAVYEGLLSTRTQDRVRPERDRNRCLRRIDLRFAAGVPRPDRAAVGSGDPVIAAGLETIANAVVPLAEAGVRTCDLVVLSGAAERHLAQARDALRPGGGCWVETRLWPHRGARDLTGRLEGLGFVGVEPMAPWPSPSRTTAWVPLAPWRAGALLRPLPRPGGLNVVKRAVRHLRARAWRLRLALRLGMPVSIVARRSGSGGGAPVSNIRTRIDERVALAPGTATSNLNGPHHCWTFATGGRHSTNKVIGSIAAGPAGTVRAIVKFPRDPASSAALEREAHMLSLLGRRQLPGVPQLMAEERADGGIAVVESALAGRAFYDCLRRGTERRLADTGREWLVGLASGAQGTAGVQVRAVGDAFATIARDAIEPTLLARGLAAFHQLEGLPAVVEHRDFGPWNLMLDEAGGLQVLDWESSVTDGVPGADLVYFLTYLGFSRHDARHSRMQARAYRRVWDAGTPSGAMALASAELVRYLEQLGLEPALALPIRLYTWALHAISEQQRENGWRRSDGRPCGLFVQLWRVDAILYGDAAGPISAVRRPTTGEAS